MPKTQPMNAVNEGTRLSNWAVWVWAMGNWAMGEYSTVHFAAQLPTACCTTAKYRQWRELRYAIKTMLPLFSDYGSLDEARAAALGCMRCPLGTSRGQVVFGAGNSSAAIMLIGQGPSLTDDQTGLPYSGPAGEFLDTALRQAGLDRDEIWLTNLHKCVATRLNKESGRPEMRPPKAEEVSACMIWLEQELFWVRPAVLVAIGGPAAQTLLGKDFQLSEQRGQWLVGPHGIPTLATYQPTYLKRLSEWDRPAAVQGWRDLVADLRAARERAAVGS